MKLLQQIAYSLGLPDDYLLKVAASASYRYKEFSIKKADGGTDRTIQQPSKELKLIQRWLIRRVFDSLPTHASAHAYVRGRSIATNAAVHRGARYISRLDFASFFPSLTSSDVRSLLESGGAALGDVIMDANDIDLVCLLTCRFGRLAVGAPSSPTISNKLLYSLDVRLSQIAEAHGVRYTRYADDLYLSASRPTVLFDVCRLAENAIAQMGRPKLTINARKTYHASRKKRMVVTGIRLTQDATLSVGRELKRRVRVLAHKAKNGKLDEERLSSLRGMLAYISSIEPDYVSRIRSRYGVA